MAEEIFHCMSSMGFSHYYLSKKGVLKSIFKKKFSPDDNDTVERIIKTNVLHKNSNYVKACIRSDKKVSHVFNMEKLMYTFFVGEIPKDHIVFHKDNNPMNNSLDNIDIISQEDAIKIFTEDPSLKMKFSYLFKKIRVKRTVYQVDGKTLKIERTFSCLREAFDSIQIKNFTQAKLRRKIENQTKIYSKYFIFEDVYEEFVKSKTGKS